MEEEAETDFSSFKTKNANSKNSTANMLILDFISHNCERKKSLPPYVIKFMEPCYSFRKYRFHVKCRAG